MPPKEKTVLVNKPKGKSTYDMVRKYKKKYGCKGKIGHAGTLDVMAQGLVILLVGEATKRFDEFQNCEKEYVAKIQLGYFSDTLDAEGKVEKQKGRVKKLTLAEIEAVLPDFIGEIRQDIPVYSSAKHQGKSLYKYARKGQKIKKKTDVEIKEIEVLNYKFPIVKIRVVCSSGTYIRQLTYDVFRKLGVESVLIGLERTRIGEYSLKDVH